MKKSIVKFWGVALVVIMLSALFVSAIPVSAGNLTYTSAVLPNDRFVGITSAGTVINDFAVSADGMTIYVAGVNAGLPKALKSVNGGRSWVPLTSGLVATDMVAIAPDNPDFVVFVDATPAAFVVTVSINGGASFNSLGAPRDAGGSLATVVNSVDVSKTWAGINYIAIAGADTLGPLPALYYFDKGAAIPAWRNVITDFTPAVVVGDYAPTGTIIDFKAVKFSPNFDIDGIAYVVSNDTGAGTSARLHAISFFEQRMNRGIGAYPAPGWIAAGTVIAATTAITVASADIVFDPLYSIDEGTLRTAYVGLAMSDGTGGVYRFTDDVNSTKITGSVSTWSLAINSTGTVLVAGSTGTNAVYTNTAPTSAFGSFVPNRQVKRIGVTGAGANVQVAWSGANVVASARGISGAFSMSTDNGLTFNDISLVNAAMTTIVDTVISPDGTKRYVITSDAAPATSIFYWDGTVWERTYTGAGALVMVANASPTNFDVLYVGDTASRAILYTSTAGKTNWLGRTGPGAVGDNIVDIEVESDSTIYVATAGTFKVGKSTFYGLTWVPGSVISPLGAAIASLTLVSPNNLIVGGIAGNSAYSTNGGMSYIPFGPIAAGGRVYTAATSLEAGSNVYAVSSADTDVYTWTMGTSLVWTSPGLAIGAIFAVGTAAFNSTGIALVDGTLYRVGTDVAGPNTEISRSLNPAAGAYATWASIQTTPVVLPIGANTAATNIGPNVLKSSAGNVLWFIDTDGGAAGVFRMLTYTDTLAVATAVPTITFPADGALIQVNRQTGVAYQTTLSWTAAATATDYAFDVALDSAFTNTILAATVVSFPVVIPGFPVNVIIGPGLGAGYGIAYQPGQTYYWRVRAVAPFFSRYSDTKTFSIMPAQGMVPEISSPENGKSVDSLTPGFSWTPIGGASSYGFELSVAPDFTTTLYSTTAPSAGAVIPSTVTLERGKTYFWRVRALTPTLGDWSAVANFTVAMPVVTPSATTQVTPTITVVIPPGTTVVTSVPPVTNVTTEVNPSYIWAIIIIGAVLVIAVIVLIVRTRRSV